jgi:long-chain-fatty-acid--CoA ligase ACSBG
MMGYLASVDLGDDHLAEIEKKTAETIDSEGWLHSGDKGLKTVSGMVRITGRYKELIIGEGGENIAPVPIEDSVKGLCDGVAECMMIGDQRKYNVCFITLKAVGANGEVPGTDKLDAAAKLVNPQVQTISGAMKDPVWIDTILKAITKTNENSKLVPNNAFKIQKFCILPENFSEEKNQLTPTKKLKRKTVETQYASMIDKMYETEGTYIEFQHFE